MMSTFLLNLYCSGFVASACGILLQTVFANKPWEYAKRHNVSPEWAFNLACIHAFVGSLIWPYWFARKLYRGWKRYRKWKLEQERVARVAASKRYRESLEVVASFDVREPGHDEMLKTYEEIRREFRSE